MLTKYTEEELKELTDFINVHQTRLGAAMVMQMTHFEADEATVHTELEDHKLGLGKFIVSTTVRPFSEELKAKLHENDKNRQDTNKPQPISK